MCPYFIAILNKTLITFLACVLNWKYSGLHIVGMGVIADSTVTTRTRTVGELVYECPGLHRGTVSLHQGVFIN